MRITAIVIGSTGDVTPFIALGLELKKRGHQYTIATVPDYEAWIKENGLGYKRIEGDVKLMMKMLLSDRKSGEKEEGVGGLQAVLNMHKHLYEDFDNACQDTDLILYMQFGALAYHFAQKRKIPCMRTFVFPSDVTRQFSVLMPNTPRNSFKASLGYRIGDYCMNKASILTVNEWRERLGLKKWKSFSSYKKMNGKYIPTLYQYSSILAPRDKHWKKHIHITGTWSLPEVTDYVPDPGLTAFLRNGEKPVFIGFGSMINSKMAEIQTTLLKALELTGQRAILSSSWSKFDTSKQNPNIYYIDFVPYEWLFQHVKAVVHHGGNGTTHLGLLKGKPTFIMAFGGDQMFWGQQVHLLGAGPEPFSIRSDMLDANILADRLKALERKEYAVKAKEISKKLELEDGVKTACDIIEQEGRKSGIL